MMGLDSHSHGPKSFHGFYADRAHYGAVAVGQVEERERRLVLTIYHFLICCIAHWVYNSQMKPIAQIFKTDFFVL